MRAMLRSMKAMLCLLMTVASVGPVRADTTPTKREAFDGCLAAGIDKFKDLCESADLVARAILFECKPQLYDLIISTPSMPPPLDHITMAKKHRLDKIEEVLSRLLEYRLQHPCR